MNKRLLYDSEGEEEEVEHEDKDLYWLSLLGNEDKRNWCNLEQARKDVEVEIVHSNQRKLVRSGGGFSARAREAETRSTFNTALAEINATKLARLLPNPGTKREQEELALVVWRKAKWLEHHVIYNVCGVVLCTIACALYVYETYLPTFPQWGITFEEWLLFLFSVHFVVKLLGANDLLSFLFSGKSALLVLATIVPGMVVILDENVNDPLNIGFLRALALSSFGQRLFDYKRLAISGVQRVGDNSATRLSILAQQRVLHRQILTLGIYVIVFAFVSAGIVIVIDHKSNGQSIDGIGPDTGVLRFNEALYYIIITLSTIGFGDVVPLSTAQQMTILAIISAFLVTIPVRVAMVALAHSRKGSRYAGKYSHDNVRERHIVVCGNVGFSSLLSCLQELFHADHGKAAMWLKVVVLSADEPSMGMVALMELPDYKDKVAYIRGSPLNSRDLQRARVQDAASVLVLVEKLARDTKKEDAHAMLMAISVLTHVQAQRRSGGGPRLLVELLNPNSALHIRSAGIRHVVSFDQLKLSMVAQSCLCPGWSALVANLVRSHSALPAQALQQGTWLGEYYLGATKTVFSTQLSPVFVGLPFSEVVATVYEQFELIIVAVEMHATGLVVINPEAHYEVELGDRALVLAESQADALSVWEFLGEAFARGEAGEEAALLESVGCKKLAAMNGQGYVESIGQNRLLNRCRRAPGPETLPDFFLVKAYLALFDSTRHLDPYEVYADYERARGFEPQVFAHREQASSAQAQAREDRPASAASEPAASSPWRESLRSFVSEVDALPEGIESAEVVDTDNNNASDGGGGSGLVDLRQRAAALLAKGGGGGGGGSGSSSRGISISSGTTFDTPLKDTRHLSSHLLVLGFPARPSHMEAFLRPLRRSDRLDLAARPSILFMSPKVDRLISCLQRLAQDEEGIDLSRIYVVPGHPMSQQDLINAGIERCKTVVCLSNVSQLVERPDEKDGLIDAEALMSFIKMELLLAPDAHFIVELEFDENMRFLHTRGELSALQALSTLAEEHSYLWPKFAAGRAYSASALDALLSQAFHRPSRIALFEQMLQLGHPNVAVSGESNGRDQSAAIAARASQGQRAEGVGFEQQEEHKEERLEGPEGGDYQQQQQQQQRPQEEEFGKVENQQGQQQAGDSVGIYQFEVPQSLLGHCFGELYHALIMPPIRATPIGLYRAKGTSQAPEPYVYTAPRADTVLHKGDLVFVMGRPAELP